MYQAKTVAENASFQKRSLEKRFLKTLPSILRVDGRKRKCHPSHTTSIEHGLKGMLSYLDGQKLFEYAYI